MSVGFVERRAKDRWKARYRGPDGRERARTFATSKEAHDFLAARTVDLRRGDWTDPKLGQITVGEWGRLWLDRKAARLKPSTAASYRSLLDTCVLPEWERVRLGDVTYHEVDGWVARLSQRLGASRVRKAHVVLSQILDAAVKDGRLSKNPARGVDLPRLPKREQRFLTQEQVHALAIAAGDYKPMVLVLAYCGLRFGEAAALRVRNVDLMRGRIRVAGSVSEINGQLVWGTPKSHQARTVPLPRFLRDPLAEHMAGKGPEDLVFTSPDGTALRNGNFRRRTWDPAARQVGLDGFTPHDLRHTTASLAVDAGANVKTLQQILGHASAAMTLDVYAGLFDDSIDRLADRLDQAYARPPCGLHAA